MRTGVMAAAAVMFFLQDVARNTAKRIFHGLRKRTLRLAVLPKNNQSTRTIPAGIAGTKAMASIESGRAAASMSSFLFQTRRRHVLEARSQCAVCKTSLRRRQKRYRQRSPARSCPRGGIVKLPIVRSPICSMYA